MFAQINQKQNIDNNNSNININNNDLEDQNDIIDNKNNTDDLSKLIKEIPLNTLNDYYDIESNIFKKRIEKLNLKFYWIYESLIGEDNNINLLYPYNKLFLILFKEISLYIEEILRLNKQLNLKNKNEKYYINKLNYYKEKEKDYLISKQMTKSLERNIKNLEKNNDKLKSELEKSNKKIFNSNMSPPSFNSNYIAWKNNIYNHNNHNIFNGNINKFYAGNITEQGSVMSSGSSNKLSNRNNLLKKKKSKEMNGNLNANRINSNSSIYTKTTNISSGNNNRDIIYLGINQCDDEINNLNIIENLLLKNYDNKHKKKIKNKKTIQSYKRFSQDKFNINNQVNFTSYKKNLFNDKKNKKSNKSLDFKTSINVNTNKI